jgi:hypothetical protein
LDGWSTIYTHCNGKDIEYIDDSDPDIMDLASQETRKNQCIYPGIFWIMVECG